MQRTYLGAKDHENSKRLTAATLKAKIWEEKKEAINFWERSGAKSQ